MKEFLVDYSHVLAKNR